MNGASNFGHPSVRALAPAPSVAEAARRVHPALAAAHVAAGAGSRGQPIAAEPAGAVVGGRASRVQQRDLGDTRLASVDSAAAARRAGTRDA